MAVRALADSLADSLADVLAGAQVGRIDTFTDLPDLLPPYDLILLTGSSGPNPADALLRAKLDGAGLAYAVVANASQALAALAASRRGAPPPGTPRWRHACAECGDPDCERHLLPR